jgi:hypothetical protein
MRAAASALFLSAKARFATREVSTATEFGNPKSSYCWRYYPGGRIPPHWYDGGRGCVTKYFYDFVERNSEKYHPGTLRCHVRGADGQLCNEEVAPENEEIEENQLCERWWEASCERAPCLFASCVLLLVWWFCFSLVVFFSDRRTGQIEEGDKCKGNCLTQVEQRHMAKAAAAAKKKATTLCFEPCSVAQTHRELAASGVWAGCI